ncbi:hypothetical protein Zm00014a_020992 [Zea mays]|uniref:BED-type domain-containing protein n=1 Tax=Zea mays TaxID=4577 RepID=A0A3L6FCP8_MAIZE|nr:hypothetical protein Zm00014a_020992 [Zea mays]
MVSLSPTAKHDGRDMSDEDRDRERERDRVWLHGEKVGACFKCKYCRETKSGGDGTRLKEHLAHRGKNVKKCPSVPPDIKAYFKLDIDKTKEKKSSRFRQQLRADEEAQTHFGDDEYEDELKAALHLSRVEHKFSQRAGARHNEAIRDWMERGRSNAPPTLDEDSPISDTPLPSTLFTSLVREQGGTEEVQEWVDETIGDTHLGKRKTRLGPSDRKGKRVKITDQIKEEEEDEYSDDNTTDPSAGDDGSHGDAGLYGAGGSGTGGSGAGDWRSTGGSRFTHSTQDSYHDAPHSQRETISGRRRSVSFPVQDGIHSSSSSGSSNYPTGQDPVYNPYAWKWQPGQRTYGPPPPSGEVPPSIMYGYENYGPPPPLYSNLSNMYPPGPQYGYGQVPVALTYHYHYDGLEQYHDPSNMPEYYHYDSS